MRSISEAPDSLRERGDTPAGHTVPAPAIELHQALAMWRRAEWRGLAALAETVLPAHPQRGKLALLVAAAELQLGHHDAAGQHIRQALAWGAPARLAADLLVAGVHGSLARVAALRGDDAGFRTDNRLALSLAGEAVDEMDGELRAVRELTTLGLLPEAGQQLEQTIEKTADSCAPQDLGRRLDVLRSEIGLLRQELALAQQRNQLQAGAPAEETREQRLKRLSTAQLGQDLWVLERTGFKRGGYFVEFGATDGILLSNTLLLENEFGWTGLCAEPNPGMFEHLKHNRRCRVSDACVGARTGESVEFVLAEEFGGMVKDMAADMHGERRQAYYADPQHRQTMVTVSLNDLLEQHGAPRDIDYLSIDTEGSEPEILEAFPFDRWRIRLITVEHNFGPNRERLRRLLEPIGYRRTEAQWDDWYELARPEAT